MNAQAALPAGLVSLGDHEAHAQTVLDANAWAYFSGTAAEGVTHRANRAAWDALTLLPRVLQPLSGSHTRVELLGRTLAFPVLVAPMAFQRMAHDEGELGTALAAAAQEAGMVLSTQSSIRMETVAQAVVPDSLRGPLWFQLYWQSDRGVVRDLIARAEEAGFEALVADRRGDVLMAQGKADDAELAAQAKAIAAALADGLSLSSHTAREAALAREIQRRFTGMALLRFTNSGTEANLMALAAALTHTGRRKVMVFNGAYHGGVLSFGGGGSPVNVPHDFVVVDYNDLDAARAQVKNIGNDLGAILVEPMLGAGGCIPGEPAFLHGLRALADDCGALLILDEILRVRRGR